MPIFIPALYIWLLLRILLPQSGIGPIVYLISISYFHLLPHRLRNFLCVFFDRKKLKKSRKKVLDSKKKSRPLEHSLLEIQRSGEYSELKLEGLVVAGLGTLKNIRHASQRNFLPPPPEVINRIKEKGNSVPSLRLKKIVQTYHLGGGGISPKKIWGDWKEDPSCPNP